MTNFINCTPHALTWLVWIPEAESWGNPTTLPASGNVARVATVREGVEGFLVQENPEHGNRVVRVVRQTTGEVTGLPSPVPGTIYIVSGMVLEALGGSRQDVVAPDTGADAVRENGQIVAVRGFVC